MKIYTLIIHCHTNLLHPCQCAAISGPLFDYCMHPFAATAVWSANGSSVSLEYFAAIIMVSHGIFQTFSARTYIRNLLALGSEIALGRFCMSIWARYQ